MNVFQKQIQLAEGNLVRLHNSEAEGIFRLDEPLYPISKLKEALPYQPCSVEEFEKTVSLSKAILELRKVSKNLLQTLAVELAFKNRQITDLEYQSAKDGWIDYETNG